MGRRAGGQQIKAGLGVVEPRSGKYHTSRERPEPGLAFSLVEAYCGPKIILDSGIVDVNSRSYIARRLPFISLVTIPRGYGMRITACPGSWECRPTVAGLAAVLLRSAMSPGCLHARTGAIACKHMDTWTDEGCAGAVTGCTSTLPCNGLRRTSQAPGQDPDITTRLRRDLRTGAQDTLCQK